MHSWIPQAVVPVAGIIMIIVIVTVAIQGATRRRELEMHQGLRIREMEHEKHVKQMELEKARIELEKARLTKSTDPVPR